MVAILHLLAAVIANLFKSRRRLEAENLVLRHQLNIALRRRTARLPLRGSDRALLMWMTRLWPSLLGIGAGGGSTHAQETAPGGRLGRTIGIVPARLKIGLQNLVYNIRRLATLERASP